MSMKINNIDVERAAAFRREAAADKSKALKAKRVEGTWNLSGAQFTAALEHAADVTTVESDSPAFMGGSGAKPDPVQYCLFGLAACFAQTFASVAAENGVRLHSLNVAAENRVNLLKPLGLGDEPVVERVKIIVTASGDGDLDAIRTIAEERCPGVYCLTKPIPLEVEGKFSST